MKILKIFFALFLLAAFNNLSKAALPDKTREKITVNNAISGFINAFCHGKIKGFRQLLDDDVKATILRGTEIMTYNKLEILEWLAPTNNIEQNCQTSYSIIESIPHETVVKVVMKYENFTRENYITLTESNEGWKIVHISTRFKA